MKILSLENYQEDDILSSSESSHEPALEPYTPESEEAHLEKEQNHIDQALQTVVTLDGITSVMESMADGFSPSAGKALMLAVEHLCSRYTVQHGKIKLPAFEEFSTKNHRKETALESLEVIKEYAFKIWDMIVKAFDAIVAFFKRIFNRQTKVNEELIKEVDTIQKDVRKSQSTNTQTNSHTNTPANSNTHSATNTHTNSLAKEKTVSSMVVFSALQINGKVPAGSVLVQEVNNHFKLMKQFDYAFSLTEGKVLKLLSIALKEIHKDGEAFQNAINEYKSEISTNNIGRIARDQHAAGDLEPGFSLYEAPLIFGGKSVYRTGITSAVPLTNDSIRFFIANSFGASTDYEIEPMPLLPGDAISEITASTKTRVLSLCRILEQREQNNDMLEKIKRNILQIRENKSNRERSARRAKVLFHVINIYFKYREVMSGRLLNHDQKVCKALLSYVNSSLSKTS